MMKLSVSIPEQDLEFIDVYASAHGVETRSGVVQRALTLLRTTELGEDYAAAWAEWDASEDGDLWEAVTADGIAESRR